MKLVSVGFGNMVSSDKLVAIVGHQSAPVKRMIQEARDSGYLIDATYGRKTRAVIIMDSGHIVLSAILPETVAGRFENNEDMPINDEEVEENHDN